jgi:hypothetical protein
MLLRLSGLIASALVGMAGSPQPAPRIWQSDVRVRALEISETKRGGPLEVHIVVATESDDAARAVRVEIMLPIGVGVVRVPDGCRPSPSPVTTLNARVTCELGDLPARSLRELWLSTSARAAAGPLRVAVFALSDTPDPFPANNFADKALP